MHTQFLLDCHCERSVATSSMQRPLQRQRDHRCAPRNDWLSEVGTHEGIPNLRIPDFACNNGTHKSVNVITSVKIEDIGNEQN